MRIASYSYGWLYLWTESTSPQLQELVVVFARLLHEESGIGPSLTQFLVAQSCTIVDWFVYGYGLHQYALVLVWTIMDPS